MPTSSRMFDRNNHSQKTIETFEIISAYYIDIFYNHLYNEAKKLHTDGSVSSVTDGYKHTLNAFLKSLASPKLYKKNIVGIHRYYNTVGFSTISFSDCIDRLVKEFIPIDYFNSLSSTQKMASLRLVLNQSIKTLIRKIVNEHMVKIIDYHADKDNARILQDDFIECLLLERESMYQRFIVSSTKTNKNETVNRGLAERMQTEIQKLVKEKCIYKKQIEMLKTIVINNKKSENESNEIIGTLHQKIKQLEDDAAKSIRSPQLLRQARHATSDYNDNYQANKATHCEKKDIVESANQPTNQSINVQHSAIHAKIPTPQESNMLEDIVSNDTPDDFIEVTNDNLSDLLNADNDYAQTVHDSDTFKMDEVTSLDDFS